MPIGCRVLIMECGSAARSRVATSLKGVGYVVVQAAQGEVHTRILHAPPCVILMDRSRRDRSNERTLAAARAARILGIPILTIGSLGSAVPGTQATLPLWCDGEVLTAAIEVACYGHGHPQVPAGLLRG